MNLDIRVKLVSGEDVLLNWTCVVVDDKKWLSISPSESDVLSQWRFGVGRVSLWIGNEETGKYCSLKNPDQEILTLFDKKVLGDTEWCLYKVDESMDEMLTSRVDPSWSMNRTHGSIKTRITVSRTWDASYYTWWIFCVIEYRRDVYFGQEMSWRFQLPILRIFWCFRILKKKKNSKFNQEKNIRLITGGLIREISYWIICYTISDMKKWGKTTQRINSASSSVGYGCLFCESSSKSTNISNGLRMTRVLAEKLTLRS